MLKLSSKRKIVSSIFLSLLSSLLVSCGVGTDKLLVFEEEILPESLFDRLTGRYRADDSFVRISNINGGLYYEGCSDGKTERLNFIVSKIPNQDKLFVMSFITTEEIANGYPYTIFNTSESGLNVWFVDPSSPIAEDYLPNLIGTEKNEASVYRVEEIKNFLVNYSSAYTQVNQPVTFKYVDNQPLTCTRS